MIEHLPVFALRDDSVVEIQGEPAGVYKAVELIATHLRKFLVDRSIVGVFESQVSGVFEVQINKKICEWSYLNILWAGHPPVHNFLKSLV